MKARPRLKCLTKCLIAERLIQGVESRGKPQRPLEPVPSHLFLGRGLHWIWVSVRWQVSPSPRPPVERENGFGDAGDVQLARPETLRQRLLPHRQRLPMLSNPPRGAEVLSTPANGSWFFRQRLWPTAPGAPAEVPGRESAAAAETCSFQGPVPAVQGCKVVLQAIEQAHHQKVHHLLQ